MKLTEIAASGLKAGEFNHTLEAVNVIVGANFKGKTARLEAVRLVLMGYLPELGKTTAATFQLCGGLSMSVRATLDDGLSIGRDWMEKNGKVSTQAIEGGPAIPAVLMDPNEYFSLGDKDRMRYVFGLTKCESLADKPVADVLIAKLKGIKIEGHTEQHEAAINALTTLVDEGDRARHDAEQPVQEWLETLVKAVRDSLKLAKQNADRMAKTVQGLSALQATEDEASIANVSGQLTKLRAEIQELVSARALLVDRIAREKQSERDRAELVRRITAAGDKALDIAEWETRQAAAQLRLAPAGTEESDAIKALEVALVPLETEIEAYSSDTAKLTEELYGQRSKLEEVKAEIARIERESATRATLHAEAMAKTCCPFCKAKKKGWQKEIQAEFESNERVTAAELSMLKVGRDGLVERVDLASVAVASSKLLDTKQTERRALAKTYTDRIRTLRGAADAARASITGELEGITTKITALREAQRSVELDKAKLAGLPPALSADEAAKLIADRAASESRLDKMESDVKTLEGRQRAYDQAKQDEKRNAQSVLEQEAFAAETAVTKEAVSILEALQGELVKQAFGTIIERANLVTAGILKTPLAYRDGEIGRWDGSTWISHLTFSGCEKAVTYAGISLGLAWDSPVKVVLMDELNGRMDPDNMAALLRRMVVLTDNRTIDQFIGCATEFSQVEGVHAILL